MNRCVRTDVDDPTPTFLLHARHHQLGQVKWRFYLHPKHQLKMFLAKRLHAAKIGHRSVVDQYVNVAKRRLCLMNGSLTVVGACEVSLYCQSITTRRPNSICHFSHTARELVVTIV